ncbi:MAG: adenylate/guanylate cyclase domain-containing protein, partial [Chthoniobacter sp.]
VKAVRKALRHPLAGSALISLLTLGVLLILRFHSLLQRPELIVYDEGLRLRAERRPATDAHIVLCGMTEEDLVQYGHPLNDEKLAVLLQKIADAKACVIGLDLYRDLKEPRSGEFYEQLADKLRTLTNVIAIERIPTIKPPPALWDHMDRVAANNLPYDHQFDGLSRSAYLYLEDDPGGPTESLALSLARKYLDAHGVKLEYVDQPSGNGSLLRLGRTTFPRLTPDAGAYSGRKIFDYEILMDFRSPQQYRTVTFGDVLEDRLPPGALNDAIVLIGILTASVKDKNPTPVNPTFAGWSTHAMIVNQLLRSALDGEPPTGWWPEPVKVLWIGFWTLLGGALGFVLRSPWKLAPALGLLLGAILLAGWEALVHALWIPVTTPAFGAFAAATFVTSLVLFLEHSERRAMQVLFSRHVSKDVLDVLWAEREQFLDGGRLKPQRITGTVLFTDLKDYSTLSENKDPADLMNWSNEYMSRIAPQVDSHGGIVIGYRGDGLMAVFGAPFAHTRDEDIDQDAIRAVECALAMRQELKDLNLRWAERGLPHRGDARRGFYRTAGHRQHRQHAAPRICRARRHHQHRGPLESLGKELEDDETTAPCTILIGDPTWRRLHDRFITKLVGSKRLKGKAKEVIVHSVLSAATWNSPT